MFCRAAAQKEVPFDPHIFFWGEELNYSARLWTHGYDMYHINGRVMYHYWGRQRGKDSSKYRDMRHGSNRLSLARNRHLLGLEGATNPDALIDIEKYGLGTKRSLADYFEFYGVDLIASTVALHAQMGLWHAPEQAERKDPSKRPTIYVAIASYRDPEISPTIADMYENATYPDNIRVGVCLQRDKEKEPECGVISARMHQISVVELPYRASKGANWARGQALRMRQGEEYVLIIDSHMRFEKRWDEILLDMLERCPSEKPALSARLPNYNPPNKRSQHPDHLIRTRVRPPW